MTENPKTVEEWKNLLSKHMKHNDIFHTNENRYYNEYLEKKLDTIKTQEDIKEAFDEDSFHAQIGDEIWWYNENPAPLMGFAGPALVRNGQIIAVNERLRY